MDYLKVSSKSSPASVAGAIAGLIKDGLPVEIQSVGAGAVNQAIKAVAIARGFLIPTGIDIVCAPTFQDIEIEGECRTAIRISVLPHALSTTCVLEDAAVPAGVPAPAGAGAEGCPAGRHARLEVVGDACTPAGAGGVEPLARTAGVHEVGAPLPAVARA